VGGRGKPFWAHVGQVDNPKKDKPSRRFSARVNPRRNQNDGGKQGGTGRPVRKVANKGGLGKPVSVKKNAEKRRSLAKRVCGKREGTCREGWTRPLGKKAPSPDIARKEKDHQNGEKIHIEELKWNAFSRSRGPKTERTIAGARPKEMPQKKIEMTRLGQHRRTTTFAKHGEAGSRMEEGLKNGRQDSVNERGWPSTPPGPTAPWDTRPNYKTDLYSDLLKETKRKERNASKGTVADRRTETLRKDFNRKRILRGSSKGRTEGYGIPNG